MTITTKFNIGDKVWFLDNAKAREDEIVGFIIYQYSSIGVSVFSEFFISDEDRASGSMKSARQLESRCFATREELIQSL